MWLRRCAAGLLLGSAFVHSPLPGVAFWTDPDTAAARQVVEFREAGRLADAARIERISREPQASWLTGSNPGPEVRRLTSAASASGRVAILVAYHIPDRDCGSFSSGGAADAADYRTYIDSFAEGLADRAAWVILEPDAVPKRWSAARRQA